MKSPSCSGSTGSGLDDEPLPVLDDEDPLVAIDTAAISFRRAASATPPR
ncbi:hypothetical protein [Streptomyces sp. NPDC056227]